MVQGLSRASVSIVIPALNEEDSIGRVLDGIPFDMLPDTEVIVVDNGSRDNTAKVALSKGAKVISEPRKGYGVATRTGLSIAQGSIVVTMDADGGHWPGDVPRILQPVATGSSLAAVGVRISSFPHGMKIRRFVGNVMLARIFNGLYGGRMTDVQCGLRAIHRKALEKLNLSQNGMQLTTELLIELKEKGISVATVRVRQIPTTTSHLREARDFAGHVGLMLKRFSSFRPVRSENLPDNQQPP